MRIAALFLAIGICCGAAAQKDPALPAAPQAPSAQPSPAPVTNASDHAGSKDSSDNPDDKVPVFRTHTDEVNLIFTVTDKHGKFIRDLKEDQFKILDNNL